MVKARDAVEVASVNMILFNASIRAVKSAMFAVLTDKVKPIAFLDGFTPL